MEDFKKFLQNIPDSCVHSRNILTKIAKKSHIDFLEKIAKDYQKWHRENIGLKGYKKEIIFKRVELLNEYLNKVQGHPYSAQSKFYPTIIQEFLYYLFKDLLEDLNKRYNEDSKYEIMIGADVDAYTNLYFAPRSFASFKKEANVRINVKNQDFAIYREAIISVDEEESKKVKIPVVCIECKTYLDKTMLEGSIATAEKIKSGNPYCLFVVLCETYEVTYNVDPAYSRIDQIFVMRKQKRRSVNLNAIQNDVILKLFIFIKEHLERDWSEVEQKLTKEGIII